MRSALLCFTLLAVSSAVPGLAAPIRPSRFNPPRSSPSDHGSGLSPLAIGGIVGGGVLATAAAVGGGVYLHKKNKKATLLKNSQQQGQKPASDRGPNPANGANDAPVELDASIPGGAPPPSRDVPAPVRDTVPSTNPHTLADPPAAPALSNLNPAAAPVSDPRIPPASSRTFMPYREDPPPFKYPDGGSMPIFHQPPLHANGPYPHPPSQAFAHAPVAPPVAAAAAERIPGLRGDAVLPPTIHTPEAVTPMLDPRPGALQRTTTGVFGPPQARNVFSDADRANARNLFGELVEDTRFP